MDAFSNSDLSADGLEAAARNVLAMLLEPSEDNAASGPESGDVLTAIISIVGDHPAALTINCTAEFGNVLAAAMFGMTPDELTAAEVQDAVGELANMIGGSVKAMLDGSWQLGLPMVSSDAGEGIAMPGAAPWCEAFVDALGHPISLQFYVSDPSDTHHFAGKDM
jgi:chemotaxis protein CheX